MNIERYNWNSEHVKNIVLKYMQKHLPDIYEIHSIAVNSSSDFIQVIFSCLTMGTDCKIIANEDLTELEIEIDEMLKKLDSFNSSSDVNPSICSHNNKRHIKFNTFEYDYCPDCKKELK